MFLKKYIILITLIGFLILIYVNLFSKNINTLKCKKNMLPTFEKFENCIQKKNVIKVDYPVQENLVMAFDFTNLESYDKERNIMYDLSGNKNNLHFNKIPSFNKGIYLKGITGTSKPSQDIGILGSGPFTIIWIGNQNSTSIGKIFNFSAENGNNLSVSKNINGITVSQHKKYNVERNNASYTADFNALVCDQENIKFYNGNNLIYVSKSSYVKLDDGVFSLNMDKTLDMNLKQFIIYNKAFTCIELEKNFNYFNTKNNLYQNYKKPTTTPLIFSKNNLNSVESNLDNFKSKKHEEPSSDEKIINICKVYGKNKYSDLERNQRIKECKKIFSDFGIIKEIDSEIYNCIINSNNSDNLFNNCLSKLKQNKIVNQRLSNVCNHVADKISLNSIDHTLENNTQNINLKKNISNKCFEKFIENNSSYLLASNSNYNCLMKSTNGEEFNECMKKILEKKSNNLELVCNKYFDLMKDKYKNYEIKNKCHSFMKNWGLSSLTENENIMNCVKKSKSTHDFKNCLIGTSFNLNDSNTPISITENIKGSKKIINNLESPENNIELNEQYDLANNEFNKYFIDNRKESVNSGLDRKNFKKNLDEINYERTGNPAWIKTKCPKIPDMSNYIRRDKIPCWGCTLPVIKKCKEKNRIPIPNKYPDNCPKIPNMDEYIRIDKIPCQNCVLPLKKPCKNNRI